MTNSSNSSLRLRVFAGPNGSGKSTIIHSVRDTSVNNRPIDFGHYINADDIAGDLKNGSYDFSPFDINVSMQELIKFAKTSGLLDDVFSFDVFTVSCVIKDNKVNNINELHIDKLAQLIARFLREVMFFNRKRFSFETVFSHESNLDIMKTAAANGYKVYLYFVSTESPEINKYRVNLRVKQGGHNVPEDKIESRYFRSLDLLFDACQIAYQAFFFDNSIENEPYKLFAHFKQIDGKKDWNIIEDDTPEWFVTYYSDKIKL